MAGFIKRANEIRDLLHDQSGVIAVIFAICIPLFVAFAALAIDMAYAYKVRNTVQVTASAAALAGVSQLDDANSNDDPNDDATLGGADSENYRREALEYAFRNLSEATSGSIVSASCGTYDPAAADAASDDKECDDIKAGHWSGSQFYAWDNTEADGCVPGTGCYVPAIMALDAVQVAARRAEVNANPLPLFFAGALGLLETDINTVAVATTGGGSITNGCLIALNNDVGEDQTFYINGQASVTTIGCDIRVDQCCDYDGGCKMGALRANGTPLVEILASDCVEGEVCADDAGIIDICGTLLEQGSATIIADTACTPDEGANFYGADQCDEPTGEAFDPLQEYAEDDVNDWVGLSTAECDFIDFVVTSLKNTDYIYTVTLEDGVTPRDAVQDPLTGTWTYTLHPGVYCGPNGMDPGGNNAKAIKFAGGGSTPNIIFSHASGGEGYSTADDLNIHGVYVIKNGALDLASSGSIFCEECGFFLTGYPATADWTGSNSITLTASSSVDSPLQGLFLVQDPNTDYTPEDQEVFIAGSTGGSYSGGVYIPNGKLTMVGTSDSDRPEGSDCLVIIADQLEFKGGATLEANSTCAGGNAPDFSPSPLFFTLVN